MLTLSGAPSGVAETVLTFPAYIKNAATKILAKGAKVIVSAATPNNVWESGTYSWGPDRFFYYDWSESLTLFPFSLGQGSTDKCVST